MKGAKGKPPAFQFYAADWLADEQLRMCDLCTRGIWIDLLCAMWKRQTAELKLTPTAILNLTGCDPHQLEQFIDDACQNDFCDIRIDFATSDKNNTELQNIKNVTLKSRRFHKDFEQRKRWAKRKARQRDRDNKKDESRDGHGDVSQKSALSSTSSSPSTSKNKPKPSVRPRTYPGWFETFWTTYPNIRRMKKKKCYEKLDRHRRNGTKIDDVMIGLHKWKQSEMWTKKGGQYCHSPEVFINNVMWEENPPSPKEITDEAGRRFSDFVKGH